ncbi:hypothetical protein MNBD_UNCLBAC01-1727 [hydrothermal vent metagenome]|uniref:Response regulatory domain-containing protein n=1 Tax=hydrothermal vent metagenome TaxID=652676 RepID=A0A3B1CZI8_9ZZZZ
MTSHSILIVEDDKHIAQLVKYNLEKAGFFCEVAMTGEEALDVLGCESIDLVILETKHLRGTLN